MKDYKPKKKKNTGRILALALIIGILAGTFFSWLYARNTAKSLRARAGYTAEANTLRLEAMLDHYIYTAQSLALIVQESGGDVQDFDHVAANIYRRSDTVANIQLAPDGKVTDVYPEDEGNDLGLDLLSNEDTRDAAVFSRDHGITNVAGPLDLGDGTYGLLVEKPVYLGSEKQEETFWGFTIVKLRIDSLLDETRISNMKRLGYNYKLTLLSNGEDTIAASAGTLRDPVYYRGESENRIWTLYLEPKDGWYNWRIVLLLYLICLLAAFLVMNVIRSYRLAQVNARKLQGLNDVLRHSSVTDKLTGIFNRTGGDEYLKSCGYAEREDPCTLVEMDIDNFKRINDIYGHDAGDRALQALVHDLKKTFGDEPAYIRNGGDEFLIFFPDRNEEEVEKAIRRFATLPHKFSTGSEIQDYTVSIGIAGAKEREHMPFSTLCHRTDAALYDVKMRGKSNVAVYEQSMESRKRMQLGFNLHDLVSGMPGAMLIYRNDESEEILFGSQSLHELCGCSTPEEFRGFSLDKFDNLVMEEDRLKVKKALEETNPDSTEAQKLRYRLRRKDGTAVDVVDMRRRESSNYYGKLYYVTLYVKAFLTDVQD
ncbi:MAG: diguanylate cyclase [Eubacterium sp.]|nr:diguanylate cyclase [Eubacterium sp.]